MKTLATVALSILAASAASATDWTRGYAGAHLGHPDIDAGGGAGDRVGYGLNAGNDYDFGDWVLGRALDHEQPHTAYGDSDADYPSRGKLRMGYDFGGALGYLVTGPAGSKPDAYVGLGVSVRMSPHWRISGEYLYQNVSDIGARGMDAEIRSLTLRAAFQF